MNHMRRTLLVAVVLVALVWLWLRQEPRRSAPAPSTIASAAPARAPATARAPARDRSERPPEAPARAPEPPPSSIRFAEDPNGALLTIDVVDEHGRTAEDAWIVPVDCEGLGPGPPRVTRIPTGPCTVRAMRRDGALFARSEPVTVEVLDDDTAYVQLELASTRTGGIGVRFAPDDAGVRVLDVVEGSPAEEAGLHEGDLVLDVGGVPTAGMDADTFVEHMTGAEHTDVTFTVGWADDTGMVRETVTVVRQFLDG
jgi:hypothetical protein